jgi:hypothetical protein
MLDKKGAKGREDKVPITLGDGIDATPHVVSYEDHK